MIIVSEDNKKTIDVGNISLWNTIYNTCKCYFSDEENMISNALKFFDNKECDACYGYQTAREFNLIRDKFSNLKPEDIVFEKNYINEKSKILKNLSPVITSLGNFYTTVDGKDLLFEVVSILSYGEIMNQRIVIVEGL